ncbi:MAG TPA: cupin domain-containing protein [Thermomicrobiales bacterium]|nr:cupin domain-containing protein [Thermomicrobiales bacterium]
MHIVHQDRSEAEDRSSAMGDMFTGQVLMQNLVAEGDVPSLRVTSVTFVDGCRNIWHTHTTEQVLIVTDGVGIVANEDGEREIVPGDVAVIQPNERHWHGAKEGHDMTHLSILIPGEMKVE